MENIPIRYINVNQKETNFSEGFSIRDIQDFLTGKEMVQKLHRHDFYYILVLKEGEGSHEIDFTSYKVCNNAVFFMRPGQVHQLSLKAQSQGYLIQFNIDFYYAHDRKSNQLLHKASNMNLYQFDPKGFKKIYAILTSIFKEYINQEEGFHEVITANLSIFFIELVRQQIKSHSNNVNPYVQERLEEFLALLETHISTHKQVSQYADMLHLSPYQLNTITKATLGKTCSELINQYIILEAKRYLLATSNKVNQIAYHLGYEDVSYFIRFFKKQTGYSPEAFRKNFR